jgi:hypothetical protein
VGLVVLPAAAFAQTPARDIVQTPARDNPVAVGTGAIRGRVLEATSDQPVRKARVHAASTVLRDGRAAFTDADGYFSLNGLPTGRYVITANKPSYINASYGQPRPLELGHAIEVADGQTVEHIDLRLSRGGVIAGTIANEFGEPQGDTQVMAMRYQAVQGTRRLVTVQGRVTNDIGNFRLFGLPPGQYYLAATLQDHGTADVKSQQTYASTYYPGTGSLSEAQLLTIAPGQTLTGMNLRLLPVRSVRVSGTVSDSLGRPWAGVSVRATVRAAAGPGDSRFTVAKPDGTFTLMSIAPGDYILRAEPIVRFETGLAPDRESVALPFTVGTDDITGLPLVTAKPSSVTGRVFVDRAELGSLRGSTFRLTAPAASPDEIDLTGGASTTVKDDFTFELKVQAGHVYIRSSTPGWFLRAARLNGVDIKDRSVEVRPNESVTGVEIELTHRQPEITGVVRTAGGEPTPNAYVVVFAQDRTRWGYLSRYVRMSRPKSDNQFRVQVPPGDYCAIALDVVDENEWTEPDFLERARERAVTFSLGDGEHKPMDLPLVSSARH